MKNKKAAIELSVGTLVIIVLAMTMLILGLMLVRNILQGGDEAISTINDQVKKEINKLFGEDKKVVIFPSTNKPIKVRQEKQEGFALGIKNRITGREGERAVFSYEIIPVSNTEKDCGLSKEEVLNLFVGDSYKDEDIPIATGEEFTAPILFNTHKGDPLCTVRFRINVKVNDDKNYDSRVVYVEFTD
ncbi:MAG: hypothetical protein QW273_02560 [Candidatus Pacearchaeota archaeon]